MKVRTLRPWRKKANFVERTVARSIPILAAIMLSASVAALDAKEFHIVDVTPTSEQTNVSTEVAIQAHTSAHFDPATLTDGSIRLIDNNGLAIPGHLTGDLGGVITFSPDGPLLPFSRYRIEISNDIRSAEGQPLEPFTSAFQTGNVSVAAAEGEPPLPAWKKTKLDDPLGATAVALGPDSRLYLATWEGEIYRYKIGPVSGGVGPRELAWKKPGARIIGLAFDPDATSQNVVLWVGYDDRAGLSVDDLNFGGTISRLYFSNGRRLPREEKVIVGLPNGDHPMNQFVFGPDGRLYISMGAITMLGAGTAARHETILSASVLVAEVRSQDFNRGQLPLNADTRPQNNYDPLSPEAPLRIFATGIREAYDLCWHTNGQLYAGVNMNDTVERSPAGNGVPAISIRPDEPLIRIVEGKYYGQPNPTRGEFVVQGGNPTLAKDPWEIATYPVGVSPDSNFDPTLLVYNLAEVGGPSANGCEEWRGSGPLHGKLLICFYTATRGIHTFAFNADGSRVTEQAPLRDASGKLLQLGAPLDLAIDHANSRIYVADFADPRRGDSAKEGALWLLEIDDPAAESD